MSDERELLRRAQRNDMTAFREIVETHQQLVYYLALDLTGNRQDAEDLAQEVFIRAYRSLGKFRGESKLSSWLYRITVNCCIDSRRKGQLVTVSLQNDAGEARQVVEEKLADAAQPGPDRAIDGPALQQHIQLALQRLTPRERSVFVLRHYNDLPLKEIGAMLDIADGTVKSLLFRAIKRLQKELAGLRSDFGT